MYIKIYRILYFRLVVGGCKKREKEGESSRVGKQERSLK
jgi:hypothetical protein